MNGSNFGRVLVKRAEECAKRTGIPVRLMIDNGPINHCFFIAEARRLGFTIVEKTFNEKILDAARTFSARLKCG